MILKFEPNYKNKISKDIVIFVVVTAFSEYLMWSYQFFFENVTYSSHMLLVSVFVNRYDCEYSERPTRRYLAEINHLYFN